MSNSCPLFPNKGGGRWKRGNVTTKKRKKSFELKQSFKDKEPDPNLKGKSRPSPGHMSFLVETQRCTEETTQRFFTPRLCHWDIMGPAWPKALFWFPSNGEENGSQRKVSVSMRCSLVRLRNAKNNTAGLVLRIQGGNYKLKTLDLRTFPGI